MAGITFRNRKYGSTLDASFTLYSGADVGSVDAWLIGDEVSVLFTLSKKQASQINEAGFDEIRAWSRRCNHPYQMQSGRKATRDCMEKHRKVSRLAWDIRCP